MSKRDEGRAQTELAAPVASRGSDSPSLASNKQKMLWMAVGAGAMGAFAVGAAAIGSLAIGSLGIGRARIARLRVDELEVGRIKITAPPDGAD